MSLNKLQIVSFASGLAGVDLHCGDGPLIIRQSDLLRDADFAKHLTWEMIHLPADFQSSPKNIALQTVLESLANKVSALTRARQPYVVMGGDHSCAIGTWSGVYDALHQQGDIGLVWVDAHMDSHTPATTITGRLHGMPLACLLGHGDAKFTELLHPAAKIKPENLCLIGVRSYEKEEQELLQRLNVRVYYMDEVHERGLKAVWQEAVAQVKAKTIGFGLSIDIDALDPLYAPGVDVPAPDGIKPDELYVNLQDAMSDPKLIATELVEFDPSRDKNNITAKAVIRCLDIITKTIL